MHMNDFTWKHFVKETLSDVDGNWSSKRVVLFIGVGLYVIAFFATTFFHYTVVDSIMNVMTSIILGGLGVTAAERFGKKLSDDGDGSKSVETSTAIAIAPTSPLSQQGR